MAVTKTTDKKNICLYIDFDGTISHSDIGDCLLDEFATKEPYYTKLLSGEINVITYWKSLVKGLNKPLTEDALAEFLSQFQIDNGFYGLVELCKDESIALRIVSDGLDIYIKKFLEMNKISGVEFYANTAEISHSGELKVSFPKASESCECFPALCKRNVMLETSSDDTIIIFIGDGHSDMCAAAHSDIIFAKKFLVKYCNEKKLPHYPFKNLTQVTLQLRNLLKSNNLKPRRQAQLMRLAAFRYE